MIAINPEMTGTLIDDLTTLWEASVRTTHHFLTEDDIQRIKPLVKTGLSDVETLIVMLDTHHLIAFVGIEADKIEMLFASPDYFGKGIGKELATLAITEYKVQYVDVNEQNPQATGFYQHIGFQVYERMDFDEQGNPFPILKMKLPPFCIRQSTPDDILDLQKLY